MEERRKFERLFADGSVILKNIDYPKDICARLENISFGGFAVCINERLELDSIVDFELSSITLGRSLFGKGKVRYAKELKDSKAESFRIGLEFKEINEDLATYFIKRIKAKIIAKKREKNKARSIDFMPY